MKSSLHIYSSNFSVAIFFPPLRVSAVAATEATKGTPLLESSRAAQWGTDRPPTHPWPLLRRSCGAAEKGWGVQEGLYPQLDTQLVSLAVEHRRAELALGKVGCRHFLLKFDKQRKISTFLKSPFRTMFLSRHPNLAENPEPADRLEALGERRGVGRSEQEKAEARWQAPNP